MTIVGVDPGQNGALAALDAQGRPLEVVDMPVVDGWVSPELLIDWVSHVCVEYGAPQLVVVEKVRSMPRQGVSSTFKFGAAWGMCVGAFAPYPIEQPSPSVWKKAMGLTADKDKARAVALERWPWMAESLRRKKDADRAEALLLAEYGRRLLAERRAS